MNKSEIATHTATPPAEKPILLFDGDCGFCRHWVARWRVWVGDRADFAPYQEGAARFPEISIGQCKASVQFITPEGDVFTGAEAVFRALALAPGKSWPWRLYKRVPGAAPFCEWAYARVARNRRLFSALTRLLWGYRAEPSTYFISRWLFLRAMGLVYVIAFVSLWTQVDGLIGERGILPVAKYLQSAGAQPGAGKYWEIPTLCWLSSSDLSLNLQCAAGAVGAILLFAGFAPIFLLAGLWCLYLSLTTVGQVFLSYQWDTLLLETGLIAVFLAPKGLWPKRLKETPPSGIAIFLLRWLLFRLMFLSGLVKILSGSEVWRDLTALTYHYQTQPLPTWTAWHALQLPLWFHKASCLLMFVIELGAPFLIFAPRRPRTLAFFLLAGLQILILATGNYAFFNLLAIALCLPLLDDRSLRRFMPKAFAFPPLASLAAMRLAPLRRWSGGLFLAAALPLTTISALMRPEIGQAIPRVVENLPDFALRGWASTLPLCSFNAYGLFAGMTTTRPEIVIEGSLDGDHWFPYEFPWKPGDLAHKPRFVAPHQPRLDWQMWFEALYAESGLHPSVWFRSFLSRLLSASDPAVSLLRNESLLETKPEQVRATLYLYRFSTPAERKVTGAWWRREYVRDYVRPVSQRRA